MPNVSIIVPNYNHARYLKQRLDSIVHQTVRDWELILLDDASTDDSLAVMERYAQRPNVRIVRNEQNSGSPFRQWMKGLALAQAEVVWFAESDDSCEPSFLQALLPAFRRPDVRLAYANSMVIDENGKPQGDYSGVEYLTSLSKTKWKKNYVTAAADEVDQALGVKNTILSASGVLFRKFELSESLRRGLEEMRLAGDWLFIAHAILGGSVWYDARPLNYHRRHKESVIASAVADKKLRDFFREFRQVQEFIFANYSVSQAFPQRWEQYLRRQWADFCPGKSFEELAQYYPFDEMRNRIRTIGGNPGAGAAPPVAEAPDGALLPSPRSPWRRPLPTISRPPPPPPDASSPVMAISHDGYRAGAQIVLLTLLEEWKRSQAFPLRLLLVDGSNPNTVGALRKEFERACPTLVLSDFRDPVRRAAALQAFLRPTPRLIYSNTVVNGRLLAELRWLRRPVVTHVHELQQAIERWAPGEIMEWTVGCSDHFVAVWDQVAHNLRNRYGVPADAITTIRPSISVPDRVPGSAERDQRRQALGLKADELAVIGCGTIDSRKGADLFTKIATLALTRDRRLRFFWIGGPPEIAAGAEKRLQTRGLDRYIRFLGALDDARNWFCAGDIFLLPSREDPFPLVALEAAEASLPIVCFADAGGMPAFVGTERGRVVPFEDSTAAAQVVLELADNPEQRRRLGENGRQAVLADYSSPANAARIAAVVHELSRKGPRRGDDGAIVVHDEPAAPGSTPLLVISHDACIGGAQIVLLELLKQWRRTKAFSLRLIIAAQGQGQLRSQFEALCPTLVLSDMTNPALRKGQLSRFLDPTPALVYSNTVVNGPLLEELANLGVPVITHIHELQKSIERWAPGEIMQSTLRRTNHFIAVSDPVAENLKKNHGVAPGAMSLINPFIPLRTEAETARAADAVRKDLPLSGHEIVVFGCGQIDWRKGPDLFVQIASKAIPQNAKLRFIWIGSGLEQAAAEKIARERAIEKQVTFIGEKPNARDYFALGHIFLLSSREDPYPLVALEALDAGLPVVCFADSGGMPAFISTECGRVVPFEDTAAAAQAVLKLASDPYLRKRLAKRGREKVQKQHSSEGGASQIADLIRTQISQAANAASGAPSKAE